MSNFHSSMKWSQLAKIAATASFQAPTLSEHVLKYLTDPAFLTRVDANEIASK